MGSGKTTLGQLLAERMNYTFVDTDSVIESSHGESIKSLFDSRGEDGFRDIETATLKQIFSSSNQIISTGGGIVLREENRPILSDSGRVYWLNPTIESLSDRLSGDVTRPLLQGVDIHTKLTELMKEREALYAACADSIIDTSDATKIESIANDIQKDFEAHYDSKR